MKKILSLFCTLALLFVPLGSVQAASYTNLPVTCHVNGIFLASDVTPLIVKGRTLLPLRAVSTALAADIDWESQKKEATVKKGDTTLVFSLKQAYYLKNGQKKPLDVKPMVQKGRILLPLRAVSEGLNVPIFWHDKAKDVMIGSKVDYERRINDLSAEASLLFWKFCAPQSPDNGAPGTWFDLDVEKSTVEEQAHRYLFIHQIDLFTYRIYDLSYHKNTVEPSPLIVLTEEKGDYNGYSYEITDGNNVLYASHGGLGGPPPGSVIYELSYDGGHLKPLSAKASAPQSDPPQKHTFERFHIG